MAWATTQPQRLWFFHINQVISECSFRINRDGYTVADFQREVEALREAQRAKYRRIGELAELRPGAEVLEIGCGWAGFMEYATGTSGCRVHGVTLSREQLAYANTRMQTAGLDERAVATLTDYRDTTGQYDAADHDRLGADVP